ncbi:MAG: Asp23/Gls24 family envelope stress response protein [Atopobiaceae bacterium]|nr:Asp23/Gls24 family envelope stress response protein [Atopobiaceae bacterium]
MAEETPKVETQVETGEDQVAEEGYVHDDDEDVESEDSLTFSNGVIEKIVALAMRDVPGVVGMKGGFINRVQDAFGVRDARKGVTVEVTPESAVRVNVSVFIAYGAYAPQVFEDVKHAVVDAVSGMTGLEVAGVNLRIEDVLTPEEIEERMPKLAEGEEAEALPEAKAEEAEQEADIVIPAEETVADEATE